MLLSCDKNAGQNRGIRRAKSLLENVSLQISATIVTYQNLIQEEIKRQLNSGNACYHSVQKLVICSSAVEKCKH
jgi:hypothetical protein